MAFPWQIFIGQFSSTQLLIYVIIQICVYLTFLGLARITYPKENKYSVMTHTMSFLGSKETFRNPKGWYFFSIAIIWITIADIPLNIYIFRHLITFSPFFAWIMISAGGISTVNGILVSFFTDKDTDRMDLSGGDFIQDLKSGRMHNVTAVITFATFIIANLAVGFAYIFHPVTRSWYNWLPPLLIFVIVLTGFFLFNALWQKKCKKDDKLEQFPGEGIYSFCLWEWLLFASLYIFLFWNVFII